MLLAAALETALVVAHFAYGAHAYDDPLRLHVVAPAIGLLALAAVLAAAYAWRPGPWTLWPLVAEVSVVYLALFGAWHGGFLHLVKDALFLGGMDGDRLAAMFASPDFAVPDDALFELSGLATLAAAVLVGDRLVRLVRAARRGRSASCA